LRANILFAKLSESINPFESEKNEIAFKEQFEKELRALLKEEVEKKKTRQPIKDDAAISRLAERFHVKKGYTQIKPFRKSKESREDVLQKLLKINQPKV